MTRESHLDLREEHNRLYGLHNSLAQRLNSVEHDVRKLKDDGDYDSDSDLDSEYDDADRLGWEDMTIPDVRDVNFELFKNRYSKEEGIHCIEVLVAGSDLNAQVCKELQRRDQLSITDAGIRVDKDDIDEPWIRRVRLQSPGLLLLLDQAVDTEKNWKAQNRTTFYRPFSLFVHAQEKMKERLVAMEEKFSDKAAQSSQQTNPFLWKLASGFRDFKKKSSEQQQDSTAEKLTGEGLATGQVSKDTDEDSPLNLGDWKNSLADALLDSYHTLLELRCYVDFVDKRIMPQSQKFDDPAKPQAQKVRFEDLYYLFRPGELVYWPAIMRSDIMATPTREVFRLYGTNKCPTTSYNTYEPAAYCKPRNKEPKQGSQAFSIKIYAVDYDGNAYGAICGKDYLFQYFPGLLDVTSLPIYPLRYHSQSDEIIKSLVEGGHRFREIIKNKHVMYCGWASNNSPHAEYNPQYFHPPGMRGHPSPYGGGEYGPPAPPMPPGWPGSRPPPNPPPEPIDPATPVFKHPIYVESEVIVDFQEAFRAYPVWHRYQNIEDRVRPYWPINPDMIDIIQWTNSSRSEKVSSTQDRTLITDGTTAVEQNQIVVNDKFLSSKKGTEVADEDLMLLPKRIFAYALRERKFFQADIRYVQQVQSGISSFDDLKIDKDHVQIIQSVVSSHFERKEMEKLAEYTNIMDQDLIRGKGRGVVILLHGAPGVGKTATAEAIALWHKKPLFAITCGDLGFTPEKVETSMSDIFRLAHLWDCILLLDEADVFLSQRELNSLQRNALVSVFLR